MRKYEEEAKVLVIQIAGLEAALWVRAGAEDRVQVREVAEAHLRADLVDDPRRTCVYAPSRRQARARGSAERR